MHRLGAVTSIVGAYLLVVAGAAQAHHGYDSIRPTGNYAAACATSNFCQTDNTSFTYFSQASLNSTSKTQVTATLNNQFDPTDLNVSLESPAVYTGGSETDTIYQIDPNAMPVGVSGVTWCDDPIDSSKCDQHYVAFYSDFWAQNITCHESGHSVGLTHGAQASPALSNTDSSLACMKTADNYNSNGLGTHNVSQINGQY